MSSYFTSIPFSTSSLYLLSALASGDAVRKILTCASGRTTVPISLPSIITSCVFAIFLCKSRRYALTIGTAEIFDAIIDASGVLMSPDTSSLSSRTICSPFSLNVRSTVIFESKFFTAFSSSGATEFLVADRPIVR